MLDTAKWLEQAERANMKVGERRRFPHTCGVGDPVLVSMQKDGLHAWCFRCDDRYHKPKQRSLREQAELMRDRAQSTQEFKKCQLPFDYTLDIPDDAAIWLYKASIRKATARQYQIGWSPSMQRIILPVFDDSGDLAFMQARRMDGGQGPKYLNSFGANAGRVLFQTHRIDSESTIAILTEDMLSAIRCSFLGPSAALCGVSLSRAKRLIVTQAKTVLIFLDPDKAGQEGSLKAKKALSVLHPDVRIVTARDDPKRLTSKEIYEAVLGACPEPAFMASSFQEFLNARNTNASDVDEASGLPKDQGSDSALRSD